MTEDEAQSAQENLKRKWANVEAVVGAENRLAMVAQDLVEHFENRVVGMDGKAMIVCMSRRICVALHDQIVTLRPQWHRDDDEGGVLKIVMTGAASDPKEWQRHIGGKARRELLAKRAKDPEDPPQADDRAGHVADRLRRAEPAHDVHRQAYARAWAHAGDRAGEPGGSATSPPG